MLKFLLSRIPEEPVRAKVLLVDDDRDVRTLTGMVLATRGVGTVYEAATGREGLRLAREQQPDLILLDVGLPDISGETVLQLLRVDPLTQHIPVVFFTGSAEGYSRLRALPASEVVLKPFHPERLCALLERTMRRPRAPLAPAARMAQRAPMPIKSTMASSG
jgi:CheY-like chemotaxis protein